MLATKWVQSFLAHAIRNCLLVVAALCVVYYAWPRKSSLSVVSDTEVLRTYITDSGQEDWFLPIVHVCRPRTPNEVSPARFEKATLEFGEVRFSEGYTLTFRGFTEGFVEVAVAKHPEAANVILDGALAAPQTPNDPSNGAGPEAAFCDSNATTIESATAGEGITLTPGTNLMVPFPTDDRPLMVLRGVVDLGELADDSGGLVLHRARYEVRQRLWRFPFALRPVVVASGDAMPGDKINVVRNTPWAVASLSRLRTALVRLQGGVTQRTELQKSTGAVIATQVPATLVVSDVIRGPAFSVFMTTPHDYSALGVSRIGAELTTRPVSGMARLANDPTPAALATFIGLFGALLALVNALLTPSKGTKREKSRE